jgi:hypothetical protein
MSIELELAILRVIVQVDNPGQECSFWAEIHSLREAWIQNYGPITQETLKLIEE